MKNNRKPRIIIIIVLAVILACGGLYVYASQFGHLTLNLPVEHDAVFTDDKISHYPAQLTVNQNRILDGEGQVVILKGVMPPDPEVLREKGKFNKNFFADIQATQANVVRIPVHPENWVNDPDYLWRYLAPIVRWAAELNLYVIIDWHYIGNVATGTGEQMPDMDIAPMDLTLEFWQLMAAYFRDTPNVIFEIFNEPESITAAEWRSSAVEIIDLIRAQSAKQIIIVGGLDFGKDLGWVLENPISGENIAYTSHIYPAHSSSSWPDLFGAVADKYPVLITEWGFMDENRAAGPDYLAGSELTYGKPFLEYLDARGIGWVGCWYDADWMPPMFTEDWEATTQNGDFILRELGK